jgi:hypothetical protein
MDGDLLSIFKLEHDIEQVQHLANSRDIAFKISLPIIGVLCRVRAQLLRVFVEFHRSGTFDFKDANPNFVVSLLELPHGLKESLSPVLKQSFYLPPAVVDPNSLELMSDGGAKTNNEVKPLIQQCHYLNCALDFRGISEEYGRGSIVVVDTFLAPDAFKLLRSYALDATIWHSTKVGGYLGAYIYDGFTPHLLHSIATEMEGALPCIFDHGRHSLNMAWAYKYDSGLQKGIKLHVDEAAVNANFWLTDENSADEDADLGGMTIFRQEPPAGTPRSQYNDEGMDHRAKLRELKSSSRGIAVVPHRANRLVLFKSNLWHMTAVNMTFKRGYKNRRINFTLLFGQRESAVCPARDSELF